MINLHQKLFQTPNSALNRMHLEPSLSKVLAQDSSMLRTIAIDTFAAQTLCYKPYTTKLITGVRQSFIESQLEGNTFRGKYIQMVMMRIIDGPIGKSFGLNGMLSLLAVGTHARKLIVLVDYLNLDNERSTAIRSLH